VCVCVKTQDFSPILHLFNFIMFLGIGILHLLYVQQNRVEILCQDIRRHERIFAPS